MNQFLGLPHNATKKEFQETRAKYLIEKERLGATKADLIERLLLKSNTSDQEIREVLEAEIKEHKRLMLMLFPDLTEEDFKTHSDLQKMIIVNEIKLSYPQPQLFDSDGQKLGGKPRIRSRLLD